MRAGNLNLELNMVFFDRKLHRLVMVALTISLVSVPAFAQYNPQPITSAEEMTATAILQGKTHGQRCTWYKDRIGRYKDTINAAARQNRIPSQLLATVVLNEMADIDWKDVSQERYLMQTGCKKFAIDKHVWFNYRDVGKQSFGIAQITPRTALKYGAIDLPSRARASRPAQF